MDITELQLERLWRAVGTSSDDDIEFVRVGDLKALLDAHRALAEDEDTRNEAATADGVAREDAERNLANANEALEDLKGKAEVLAGGLDGILAELRKFYA